MLVKRALLSGREVAWKGVGQPSVHQIRLDADCWSSRCTINAEGQLNCALRRPPFLTRYGKQPEYPCVAMDTAAAEPDPQCLQPPAESGINTVSATESRRRPAVQSACTHSWGVPRHFGRSKTPLSLTFCSFFVCGVISGPRFSCDKISSISLMIFLVIASGTSGDSACRDIFGGKTGIFFREKVQINGAVHSSFFFVSSTLTQRFLSCWALALLRFYSENKGKSFKSGFHGRRKQTPKKPLAENEDLCSLEASPLQVT